MTASVPIGFANHVVSWQQHHGRHTLPWQNTRDPYRVWLSEVMLQQTQVSTVLSYYESFLQRFPDVAALAVAPLDDVFALWSGLGYYSRARNLHRCAQVVSALHGGQFPTSAEQLAQLPGIGRSTAAAIAAFCFGERVAIMDGNVRRVLSRVLAFEGDLSMASQEKLLWQLATDLLPTRGIEAYTQGLMDLGATICTTRSPSCLICPVKQDCFALQQGQPERYPIKTRKLKRGQKRSVWLWLRWKDVVWLSQRGETGVWAGLWSFPEFGTEEAFAEASANWVGEVEMLPSFTHVLTHLDWTLQPVRWTLPPRLSEAEVKQLTAQLPDDGRWFDKTSALALGLPAPLRKLLSSSGQ